MKKVMAILGASAWLLVSLAGCRVEKTGEDTYSVTAPTETAKDAMHNTETAARQLGEETSTALDQAGRSLEKAGRNAAQKTGTALEKGGKELQKHARPGDQK
ncbi:MAG: hypothetical protein WBX15_13605 [Thermoanaerobaculia bacterium]